MKRLKLVLLAVAIELAETAVVSSPGMAQLQQPFTTSVTPTSNTRNIPAEAAAVTLQTAQGQSGVAMDCAALATRDFSSLPDARLKITSASDVAATATDPAYCKVAGTVASDSQFVVQLPSSGWTGQYFESGCGGYCGNLRPNEDCEYAFSRGAAIGYSDLGHEGSPDDMSWALNEDTRLDFAYAANHELAVAAKAIVTTYYGQPAAHNYFIGCSDGGPEALMEAQRFPEDFDGVVAGAPAYLLAFLNTFKHAGEYRANTDPQGNPIITDAKATVLHKAVLAACDELDGVADGLIFDPRGCTFDPGTLLCPNDTDASDCLTQDQVDAVRKLYSSPVDAQGVAYYPGTVPYGSELRWTGLVMGKNITDSYAGYLSMPLSQQDTSQNADTVRFEPDYFASLLPMASVYDASNPDLSAFRDHGGKLILYHGWSDDSISPLSTIAYYVGLQQQMGGQEATQQFSRLFMFPGVYHCSGGYGPSHWDMVTPITDWVEHDLAPTQIVATQYESDAATAGGGFQNPTDVASQGTTDRVVRTLPAFPYPLELAVHRQW